jgi:hypothetical protein
VSSSQSDDEPAHARWVFLPAVGAALAHAPVLRFDLLPALRRPIDDGRTLRGRRLLGDNKTWRGAGAMFGGVLGTSLLLTPLPWYRSRLPAELRRVHPATMGSLLGASVVFGELPNSFVKRQLDIAPGARGRSIGGVVLSVFDQADFVLASWLFMRPVWKTSVRQMVDAFATVAAVHLAINVVGYKIGARTTAI